MRLMPSNIDMCVWVNNKNSTMFNVTCKKLSLLKIPTYTYSAMPATHVTLNDAMIHATNSNLRNDGGKTDLMLKCAANGAGARSPFSQASPFS